MNLALHSNSSYYKLFLRPAHLSVVSNMNLISLDDTGKRKISVAHHCKPNTHAY